MLFQEALADVNPHAATHVDYTHFTIGQDGWEEVADYALDWAISHRRDASNTAA